MYTEVVNSGNFSVSEAFQEDLKFKNLLVLKYFFY